MPEPKALERLTVVCTGSVNAALLPWWLAGMRLAMPEIAIRAVVTRSAARFVSADALSVITGHPAALDVWPDSVTVAPHVELVEWSDAFAVYPATAHTIARLATGLTDTPSMLALQCTRAPVAVAPALPEGCADHPVTRRHLATLSALDNVLLMRPTVARSWSTGRDASSAPPPFPDVVKALQASLAEGRKEEER